MKLEILPLPKFYEFADGVYGLNHKSKLIVDPKIDHKLIDTLEFFQKRYNETTHLTMDTYRGKKGRFGGVSLTKEYHLEGYKLIVDENGVEIKAGSNVAFHYGLMTLLQLIKSYGLTLPFITISDDAYFKHRGVYHDVTRGKVPKLETLYDLIDLLSEYKINELQLYIEHTYLWEGLSEVFRDKDAYSAQDILKLDAYAQKRHIELIPSIATFGHMYEILESHSFRHLSEKEIKDEIPFSFVNRMAHHTLDVTQKESLELVRSLIEQFIPLFSSKKFNICGDETFDLGRYKNQDLAKRQGVGRLYVDFLKKIIEIVQENDREVLFWGDIILNHPEYLNEIPKNVICLNWGYMAKQSDEATKLISASSIPQYVCPSTTGWNRMINWFDNSSENIRTMVKHAVKYDAYGILNTDWGDHGHVNLLSSSLPMLVYGAALSWNPQSMRDDTHDDQLISKSLYGPNNSGLVDLLRRISREQNANWSFINFHLEKDYANKEVIDPYKEIMKQLDSKKIYQSKEKLEILQNELLTYSMTLGTKHSQDFNEFLVMIDLMSLTQEAFLYLMKYEMCVENIELTRPALEIAVDLEYTCLDYQRVWRERNRESELRRVLDTFYKLADRLRSFA
ncbi:family 20 glycosylhydrolase [Erysipelothrix urinaevulpis]|uniref:beta-N-acetylhexosaminidase n=1 Tax=Erysipelothrix urinaevulpis TaxID=2683717 RepID=UPI00135940F4|nr:family 20 glycosylhydrolase [Erysipelothrix urinaevulpis]